MNGAQALDIILGLSDPVSYVTYKGAKMLLSNPGKNMIHTPGTYRSGYCTEYAVALSRKFGYELAAFVTVSYDKSYREWYDTGISHAFCIDSNGNCIDVDGSKKLSDIKKQCMFMKGEKLELRRNQTEKSLDEIMAVDESVLQDAIHDVGCKYSVVKNPTPDKTRYMYHWTTLENYEKIRKQGLKINQNPVFLLSGFDIMQGIYGCIPICLSVKKSTKYSGNNGVLISVDVSGLKLLPDIFSFVDHGAYLEENSLWFSRKPRGTSVFLDEDNSISYIDLVGKYIDTTTTEACIKLTGTACVTDNIPADRISVVEIKVKLK